MRRIFIAVAALACGSLLSFDCSHGAVSLSIDSAHARVGRPLTPVSGAGVARRTTARAVTPGVGAPGVGVAPGGGVNAGGPVNRAGVR